MRHTTYSSRPFGWARAAVAAAVVVTLLAACGESDASKTEPKITPTKSATTPSPTGEAWESNFNADELAAYREASARLLAYQTDVVQVWAAGKATPASAKILKEYLVPWQYYFGQLERYEKADIRLVVRDRVLKSQATRIKLGGDGASVSIVQCVDQTASTGTQSGKELPRSAKTPQLVDYVLSKIDERWLITEISNSSEDRPCTA
jgi:hypothetical protein